MKRARLQALLSVVASGGLLFGCTSVKQVRVQNASTHDFTQVRIAGVEYGDLAPAETTDYKTVRLSFRYAAMQLQVDGKYVTAQALNFGAERFTYRIGVSDFDAGHLRIDVVRDRRTNDDSD